MLVYLNIATAAWLVGLALGFLLGRLDRLCRTGTGCDGALIMESRKRSTAPNAAAQARAAAINIDDTKFVAPINTAGMARNEKIELGKTVEIADDINSSVSKLAQLKGK